jgi:hypothetical protein
LQFLRKRSDDIPPKRLNELPQFLQGRTVLFGGRLLQLYIYKDRGRPDFGLGRMDHLESISQHRKRLAFDFSPREDLCAGSMFQSGQLVRVNLAGLQTEGVMFQAAVTDAVGHIVKQTSEQPPKYLVKLLFSFRGVTEVEVPADRIHAD